MSIENENKNFDNENDAYDVSSYDASVDNYDEDEYDEDEYDEDEYDEEDSYDEYDDMDDSDDDAYDDDAHDYARKRRKKRRKKSRKPVLQKPLTAAQKAQLALNKRRAKALKKWAPYVDDALRLLNQKNAVTAISQSKTNPISPLEVAAAMTAQKPVIPGMSAGMTADLPGGWLRRTWLKLVQDGSLAKTMSRGRIGATGSTIARHVYSNLGDFLAACRTAIAGQSLKTLSQPSVAVAGAATVAALTGNTIFAVIIRLSTNTLTYERTPVNATVEYGEGAYTFTQTYLLAPGSSPFFEAVILLPANNAGMGVVARSNQVRVTIAADALVAGTKLTLESVNGRDI